MLQDALECVNGRFGSGQCGSGRLDINLQYHSRAFGASSGSVILCRHVSSPHSHLCLRNASVYRLTASALQWYLPRRILRVSFNRLLALARRGNAHSQSRRHQPVL